MKSTIAAFALLLGANPALAQEPPAPGTVAFFGLRFFDMSTEGAINGVRPDETMRTEMATDLVARDMLARGFDLVPIDSVADQLETITNPADCNGCDTAMAAKLGADYALTGEVRKISNLILSVELNLRDAESGQTLRAGTVDIRGNTDETWQRGMRYLLRNIMFRQP